MLDRHFRGPPPAAMRNTFSLSLLSFPAAQAAAGQDMRDMHHHSDTVRADARAMPVDPLGVSMDRMGSGTTWIPDAAPIPAWQDDDGRVAPHGTRLCIR